MIYQGVWDSVDSDNYGILVASLKSDRVDIYYDKDKNTITTIAMVYPDNGEVYYRTNTFSLTDNMDKISTWYK